MSDLTPTELRILVAVAEARGFTAAASRIGMTQSAVSHAVRASERKLGAVLFERGRSGARPTAAGERAVTQARHLLRLLDTMGSETRGAATGTVTGTVRIAAFRSAAAKLLPGVLNELSDRHPALHPRVAIVRDLGRGSAGEVLNGHADLGITTVPPTSPVPEGLIHGTLFEERYLLVAPAGAADPRALPLVDWSENCSSYTRQWWADQDWMPQRRIMAEDDSVVLSMVAAGLGIAVMPLLSIGEAGEGVTVTDLGPGAPTRHLGYVTTPALAQTLGVRALIRELRNAHLAPDAAVSR